MGLESLLQTILSQEGLMGCLFVGLLVWVLKNNQERETRIFEQNKDRETKIIEENRQRETRIFELNEEREHRYINTINNLTTQVSDKVDKLEGDISEIKQEIRKVSKNEKGSE